MAPQRNKRSIDAVQNGKKQSRLILLFFLVCILWLAPAPAPATSVWEGPVGEYSFTKGIPGGRIVFSITTDPKSFNPIVAKETSTTQITGYLFSGLVSRDPLTLEVIPELAESWETRDGREWIFHLRQDVRWSDGEPFTADDVLFTFNDLIYNPDIPANGRQIYIIQGEKIRLEKIDAHTVKFILPSVFAPFLESLSQEILPRHVYEPLVDDKSFSFSMGLDTPVDEIVGCGPFRIQSYVPGLRVVLKRNPLYYKKDEWGQALPYLDEIIFAVVGNQDTALLRFLEGQIDYYSLRPQDIAILGPQQKEENFRIFNTGPEFGSNFIVLNQNPQANPHTGEPFVAPHKLRWFTDKRFRRSIAYAINREKIVNIVLYGLGQPQYSPVSQANPRFYNPRVKRYPYDPQEASLLLRETGLIDRDGDGIREDENGNKLQLNFFTNSNSSQRVTIATLIKKDLEDVGFKIHFLPLNFNNLVNKLTSTFDWELILIGLTGGLEPHFGKNVWSYRGPLHMWNPTREPLNQWEEDIEDIFNRGVQVLEVPQRKELYDRWQAIVSRELPVIYTVTGETIFAVRNTFGNMFPTVYGGAFPEIERVYIQKQSHTTQSHKVTREEK